MQYQHTQTGGLHHLIYAVVGMFVIGAWFVRGAPGLTAIMAITGALILVLAVSLKTLTVQDEGEALAVRFGPAPLFSKTIAYGDITAVEPDRTKLIDGWGIHYVPWRGWTWNLWGFDCVKLTLGRKVLRIGTDDVENLVAFLQGKLYHGNDRS